MSEFRKDILYTENHKTIQMKKYIIFMDWKNQYCKDVNPPKFIYRVNVIPNKISADST